MTVDVLSLFFFYFFLNGRLTRQVISEPLDRSSPMEVLDKFCIHLQLLK